MTNYLLLLFLMYRLHFATNEETSCGCGNNREKTWSSKSDNIYVSGDNNDECPANNVYLEDSNVSATTKNMVAIPEGVYQVGTDDVATEKDNEGPMRFLELDEFYLDRFEVSNRDFKAFVKATKYQTEAEVFGDSFVFALFLNDTMKEGLKDYRVLQAPWWYKVSGADWSHPYGPDSNIKEFMDHPVIHVSWRDAQAFCKWRGARLPTESEWEAACRGGKKGTKYPWGDKLFQDRQHRANIWQGSFPNFNSEKDGYIGTNPVHEFEQNDFGLHNMAGNVWEWVEDSWDKDTPNEKVKKGGSYLCHRSYCYRYRCSARSHNTEDSSAGNLGFRCAKSQS